MAQIGIVVSPEAAELNAELDRIRFPASNRILNPEPERGMFGSIQSAAGWSGWQSALTHFVVTLGDQPHLRSSTLEELLRFAAREPEMVVQPRRNGRPRHPVVLPRRIFAQLPTSKCSDLKEFLSSQRSLGVESDDAGLDFDMDTPQDYEALLRLAENNRFNRR